MATLHNVLMVIHHINQVIYFDGQMLILQGTVVIWYLKQGSLPIAPYTLVFLIAVHIWVFILDFF